VKPGNNASFLMGVSSGLTN